MSTSRHARGSAPRARPRADHARAACCALSGAGGGAAPGGVCRARSRSAARGAAGIGGTGAIGAGDASRRQPRIRHGGAASTRLRLALAGAAEGGHVLGGYRFVAWRGRILVLRELAAAAGARLIEPGDHLFGTGGLTFRRRRAARPLTIGYLGKDGLAELHRRQSRRPQRAAAGAHPSGFAGVLGRTRPRRRSFFRIPARAGDRFAGVAFRPSKLCRMQALQLFKRRHDLSLLVRN